MNTQIIQDALQYGGERGGSPLLFSAGKNSENWYIAANSDYFSGMRKELEESARAFENEPLCAIPFSLFRLYEETGDRETYQNEYFSRRKRLNTFVLRFLLYENPADLAHVEDMLWLICDEFTWCLPAHLGNIADALDKTAAANLDLFNCETAFALAEILYLLGEKIASVVRKRAEQEIFRRVLNPFIQSPNRFWWETADMNWAAVCAGSVGAAALYLIPEDEGLALFLERILPVMECYLSGFSEEGACLEGMQYWTYGFGFFTCFADLLCERTTGKINLFANPKVKNIALFQQKCFLDDSRIASFSDCEPVHRFVRGLTCKLNAFFSEVEIPDFAYGSGVFGDNCFRWQHAVRNLIWSRETAGELPEQYAVFEDAGMAVCRTKQDGQYFSLALKAGHNDEPHNHNDIGSFLFLAGGEMLLTDPGRGLYTREYFGAERYSLLSTGSHGHSVPIVDGCFQKPGRAFSGKILKTAHSPDQDEFSLELAGAYGIENLHSLRRDFRLDKAEKRLEICDRYVFETPPSSLTERFITFHKPTIADGKVHLAVGYALAYDSEKLVCAICEEVFQLPNGKEKPLYCIDFDILIPKCNELFSISIQKGEQL